ncbi:MAG TPA: cob(I)yrinic acid a,c-diamide adenosyltransferase [Fibrobacteria bacterium]|nr:cob(I)yrinic acid a,c-diamide adenosyltransferase [Fibrobacteria bacterium]
MRLEQTCPQGTAHRGITGASRKGPPRILAFTGDGKGKTTAAAGMVLRGLAAGMRVLVVQFVKSRPSGEMSLLATLGAHVEVSGMGFVPPRTNPQWPAHFEAARRGLLSAAVAVGSGSWDMVVLDEIGSALAHRLVEDSEIHDLMEANGSILVLTGRGIPHGLQERCDTVSRIDCVKHAYQRGIPSQVGVER